MKTVLCYGDSNVWGYMPGGGRYPWEARWPGRLSSLLGGEYRVIEEGLNGRTTGIDDPNFLGRNGNTYLPIVLETHYPADIVVLMLGTNDLKCCFNRTSQDIIQGVRQLIQIIQTYLPEMTEIILISPPSLIVSNNHEMNETFNGGIKKSQSLAADYLVLANQIGCHFIDAAKCCSTSIDDGVHLDAASHWALADAVFHQIMGLQISPSILGGLGNKW